MAKRKPKQEHLPTMEPVRIAEIDDAAAEYQAAMMDRLEALKAELAARAKVMEVMRQHETRIYRTSDGELDVILGNVVKVRAVKDGKETEE